MSRMHIVYWFKATTGMQDTPVNPSSGLPPMFEAPHLVTGSIAASNQHLVVNQDGRKIYGQFEMGVPILLGTIEEHKVYNRFEHIS